MAFKAEELTTQILPTGDGLWACPESTVKGHPCDNNTKPGCPDKSIKPGGPACFAVSGHPRPARNAAGLDRDALILLQGQLRDRLAQGPAAAGL